MFRPGGEYPYISSGWVALEKYTFWKEIVHRLYIAIQTAKVMLLTRVDSQWRAAVPGDVENAHECHSVKISFCPGH